MSLLDRIGMALPVVQAGMGGGVSRHELAAAVSDAGGLGTIAVVGAEAIRRELALVRERTSGPVAVNVLLPVASRSWFEAAERADVVVTFWGRPRRRTAGVWIHQCGSVDEALAAHRAGADAAIVQGVEAGGHVRGSISGLELLRRTRDALPPGFPLLLAGGIADRSDVQRALDAGACAAVAGTRFLLTPESRAHPEYKARLLAADATMLTDLFGFGWPALHRVVPNAATERRVGPSGRTRAWTRFVNGISTGGARYAPARAHQRLAERQRPSGHLFTPLAPVDELPASFVDAGPLYAGETVARITALRSAGELVPELGV